MRPLCALLIVMALGCTKSAPTGPVPKKKSVVIGLTQEPDTLWMPMKQMNVSEHVGRPGALSLTVFDDDWKLQPWAAESIPTVANGGVVVDGNGPMTVTWKLRDGLFWADGKPVTSHDFVFTYELYKDPELEIVDRTVTDRVTSMKAVDDKTFTVTFAEPYAYYAVFRNHEVLPKHLVEPIWKAKGRALKEDKFGTLPTLGGAFTIAEWVPGSHVTARRNPHAQYFAPKLDEITWRFIPATSTLEANLLSGSIDAIGVIGITLDQALALEKRLPEKFEIRYDDALHFEHIDVNLDNPILKDKRVREALLISADREGIVAKLFAGKQTVAHGFHPPGSPFYDENVPKRAFDVARAKALLDEAGWVRGDDGIRTKDGARLRLTLMTTAGDKVRELVQELLVSSWKNVGIEIQVQNQPAKILFGDTLRHRKFEALAMFTWSLDPMQINEAFWRCDQIPREENGWKGQNYPGYCNPSADTILASMTRELDDEKRAKLGRDLDRILAEDLPQLPLYFRKEISVIPRGFKGWRPVGILGPMGWNAHEWDWP